MPTNKETSERHSVLVVDDSNVLRSILKEELEAEGFAVYLAENGERGLELARDQRPDVILLDLMLPELDGYDVCRSLKDDEALSHIPVLLLSAKNELKDKLAGFESGADDYLTKPFFTKELVVRLRTHLRVKENLDSSRRLGQFYLELLFGIGSAITSPFKVDDDLEIILRQALVAAQARRGSILLLDRSVGTLEVKGTLGYNGYSGNGDKAPEIGDKFRISDKLPLVDLDNSNAPLGIRLYDDDANKKVFIPMVAKEELVGGIEIELDDQHRRFSANDQKLMHALASQAAIFIENARLERDVRSMFLQIIVSMAGAVDAKDAYTHGHSLRVARVALLIAQQLEMPREEMETMLLSAVLHDVGKIAIPDEILKKPTRLSKEEFEIMKGHTTSGAKMLAHIPSLENVIPGILEHHEYWNGSGYPGGLAGEDISLLGRIIHIGDAFDAMTTDRIYRRKVTVADTMEEIVKFSGVQFDPECVKHLERAYAKGIIYEELPDTTPTIYELIEQIQ